MMLELCEFNDFTGLATIYETGINGHKGHKLFNDTVCSHLFSHSFCHHFKQTENEQANHADKNQGFNPFLIVQKYRTNPNRSFDGRDSLFNGILLFEANEYLLG